MKKFLKQQEGAAAIEFALIAPVLFLLIFGVLEFAMIGFLEGSVNTVVHNAGRMGMTGGNYAYLQDPNQPPLSREDFLNFYIQDRIGPLANLGQLEIRPIPYGNLSAMNAGGGTNTGYGGGGEVVVYEVTFTWNVLTPLLGLLIGNQAGQYIIRSHTVMQNETF